jgi:glutamate--cysteine ligase
MNINALLITQFARQRDAIESWFEKQWQNTQVPFYTSVDIRDSGFKLAPVDTNLFPAGFNNLSREDKQQAPAAVRKIVARYLPTCHRILLIPENHTRNLYYLENIASLQTLLQAAGFTVKLGTLEAGQSTASLSGIPLQIEQIERQGDSIQVGDFNPELILLNNDLAEGIPALLQGVKQTLLPPMGLGWHQRLKSQHFKQYSQVCRRFANHFSLETWTFNPLFSCCTEVDFMSRKGESCLSTQTTRLLQVISEQYQQRGILDKPYIVIKADSGSYGMGVLTVDSLEKILHLSRRKRSHMMRTKGNRPIQQVILQEGIPSTTLWQSQVAEPVIYLLGTEVVGGFYRTHAARGPQENLNIPGMQLPSFTFGRTNQLSQEILLQDKQCSQLYAYGVIARLAALAAAQEYASV